MARRFKLSGLDERPTLAEFDWRFNPMLPRAACLELHTIKFVGEGGNALLVGKPGTCKSHIAKAVAYQATLQGYEVGYVEADAEFVRNALAQADEQARLLKAWVGADLLVPMRTRHGCLSFGSVRPNKRNRRSAFAERRFKSDSAAPDAQRPIYSAAGASTVSSGRSTSSTKAMGALSPTRKPIFKMRV